MPPLSLSVRLEATTSPMLFTQDISLNFRRRRPLRRDENGPSEHNARSRSSTSLSLSADGNESVFQPRALVKYTVGPGPPPLPLA